MHHVSVEISVIKSIINRKLVKLALQYNPGESVLVVVVVVVIVINKMMD